MCPMTPALYSPPVCREAHSHAGKPSMVSQIMYYLNGRQKYISARDTLSESDPTQTHPRTLQPQSLIICTSSIPSASTVPTPEVLWSDREWGGQGGGQLVYWNYEKKNATEIQLNSNHPLVGHSFQSIKFVFISFSFFYKMCVLCMFF
jgi:hypothetical protein